MRALLASVALALFVPDLTAQTVLFEDDFDDNISQWTASPWFQWLAADSPCISSIAPVPSRSRVMRYGRPDGCDFEGTTGGTLVLNTDVAIPADASDVWLRFWSFEDTEPGFAWDFKYVYVSADGGATWDFRAECTELTTWYQKGVDLSEYAGQDIRIMFFFDPVDWWINAGLGWVIDSVRIEAQTGGFEEYCQASVNSTGQAASLTATGSVSIGSTDLDLHIAGGPSNQWTALLVGPNPALAPFGDGFLCLGPGATGIHRVVPAIQLDGRGALTIPLDTGTYPLGHSSPAWVTPGSTWRFQARFRDPLGPGGTGVNFTSALAVTFLP